MHRAGTCGSCPHQDLSLDAQLRGKQARVAAQLQRIPARAWQHPAASAASRFRNKAKMVVSGTARSPVLGIVDRRGRAVDLRTCPLHVRAIEDSLPILARTITRLGITPYDIRARTGELKYLLVTASPDGDLMVRWVLRSRRHLEDLRRELVGLREQLPTLTVVSINLQPVAQAVIEGEEEIVLSDDVPGGDSLLMRLRLPLDEGERELPLHLPTRSFFQTNTAVAQELYATAARWSHGLEPASGEEVTVWDLFCGVGGFALALSGPGRRVLGVEVSAPAIKGARRSAALMGLEPGQARFEAGDARILDPGNGPPPDLLVVNPPRRGIGAELAERIERSRVRRVLYSSCNPLSLARDLESMPSLSARRARLFDMFPHTDHAEVMVDLLRE